MKISAVVASMPNEPFSVMSLELDEPRANEVRVKIVGVGICHTDIISRDQQIPVELPAVLGHEGAGIVEAVGSSVNKVKVGDRVVLSYLSCGVCPSCEAERPSYCHQFAPLNFLGRRSDGSSGMSLDGAPVSGRFFGQSSFASHALVEERNVVKVDIDDQHLPLVGALGCGFQTGAGAIMNSLACQAGESVLIIGGGAVGMSAVIAATICGCNTILLEPNAKRRDLAIELGAAAAFDPQLEGIEEALFEAMPRGINTLFDTSGVAPVIERFVALLAPRAKVGLVAASSTDESVSLNITQMVVAGISVKGILEGDSNPDVFIPELIEHIKSGRFPVEKLSKTFRLDEINEAISEQKTSAFVKAVLIP